MSSIIRVGTVGYPIAKNKVWDHVDLVELTEGRELPPKAKVAKKWKAAAPSNVLFTVQASRHLTDPLDEKIPVPGDNAGYGGLDLTDENRGLWQRCLALASAVEAKGLVIITPPSVTPAKISKLTKFFSEVERKEFKLIWEPHGPWSHQQALAVADDLSFILALDPLRDTPQNGDVAYFRFGSFAVMGSRMGMHDLERVVEAAMQFKEVYCVFDTPRSLDDVRNLKLLIEELE